MKMAGKASHNILNIRGIIDDAKCFYTVRELRWSDRVGCAHRSSDTVVEHGRDETRSERQRYHCRNCNRYFDDLTGTIFEGHHTMEGFWSLIAFPVTSASWYLSGIITKLSWVLRVRAQRETARRKTFAVPASAIPRRLTWNPIRANKITLRFG
uniref:Transposase n=1 Tax=Candidatus Kentrum eta TaxID=2126337 RepID=A0A450VGS9_9GAMM|nr:MAG: hypothetical protein BECKH772A_GA0070896_103732 [Candidatus Kentron sp. H]